jgi:2-polyprenyl-3-methyl-5-hydroxy-6-metoxy-1,4-benzoquinol methylase
MPESASVEQGQTQQGRVSETESRIPDNVLRRAQAEASRHFAFGQNWEKYASLIDQARLDQACADLQRLVGDIAGRTFLDIGCGSGLHSLAAARLGATRLVAVDVDGQSVATTQKVLRASVAPYLVRQASVFDLPSLGFGTFDIVYSWGVLHHTGAMREAITAAAAMVKPGGLLAIALYKQTPFCAAWRIEKRLYAHAPAWVQAAIRNLYVAALWLRKGPTRYRSDVDNYISARGMDFHHDVHDWLGGYPYESISPEGAASLFTDIGFTRVSDNIQLPSIGLFGTGCDEYVYRRGTSNCT